MTAHSPACSRWAAVSDREAIGDALSPEEQRYLQDHPAVCDSCAAFAGVQRELEALLEPDENRQSRMHRRAGGSRLPQTMWPAPRLARVALALGALAACAAFSWKLAEQPAPPPAAMAAHLSSVGDGVDVDGDRAREGMPLPMGAVVLTLAGRACLDIQSATGSNAGNIHACLSPASRVRVTELDGARRRLEVLAGKLSVELDPQPPGTSFTVETREGTVTAIGTAFSVEVPEDGGPVVTRVLHGTVAVHSTYAGERRLGAHSQWLMTGDVTRMPEDVEAREGALLARASEPAIAVPEQTEKGPPAAPSSTPPRARERPAERAEKLLIQARSRSAAGDARGTADAYRELLATQPRSAEANAARVPYGELELSVLGDARSALALFEQYLAVGGPLSEEASYGRIRALRALGRTDEERAAIRTFLEQYPEASASSALRDRQKAFSEDP